MGKEGKVEVERLKSEIFTPLSKTESGLSVISPPSILKADVTYSDQALEVMPFAAELAVENIERLVESEVAHRGAIVDIGCGTGMLVQSLRAIGYQAYGIEMLDEYGQDWVRSGIDQYCYIGNIEDVPGVRSDSFVLVTTRAFWDSAFGTEGKGGINDPDKCLKEISRIIQPNGVYFVMSDNNRHFGKLAELAGEVGLSKFQASGIYARHSRLFTKS